MENKSQERKYLHLLSFAKIGWTNDGKPTVLLLNEKGESLHTNNDIPIVFSKELQDSHSNRIFDTVLSDNITPIKLINVLAEFEEEWFEEHKANIPSFKNLEWKTLKKSDRSAGMTPTDPPPKAQPPLPQPVKDENQDKKNS